jgi:hypothetical protein
MQTSAMIDSSQCEKTQTQVLRVTRWAEKRMRKFALTSQRDCFFFAATSQRGVFCKK